MKKVIFVLLFLLFYYKSFTQLKTFTVSSVECDSVFVKLKFNVFFKDSIIYPLYSNKSFINVYTKEFSFFNTILEKFNDTLFMFTEFNPNEKIEYVLNSINYNKFAKTKSIKIENSIFKVKNVIGEGLYRVKLRIKLNQYNKNYKNYESEFIYFYVKYPSPSMSD